MGYRRAYHLIIIFTLISLIIWLALVHQALSLQACHCLQVDLITSGIVTEHFAAANSRRITRYGPLLSDLECFGLLVNLITIEIGCLGHFLPSTVSNLFSVPFAKIYC